MIRWLKRLFTRRMAPPDIFVSGNEVIGGSDWIPAIQIYPDRRHVASDGTCESQPRCVMTDWDVAQEFEQSEPEPGRIEYRFLGVTGEEDS